MALDTPLNKVQNVGGIAAFGGLLLLTLLGAAGVSARAESVLRGLQVRVSEITSYPQTLMVGPGTTVKVEQHDELRMAAWSAGAFTDKPASSRLDASSHCTDFCPIHPHAIKEVAVP